MTRHGVALIGLGLAVEPHAQALMDLSERVDVVWAASRSAERCAAFAKRYPFKTTTDFDAVMSDPAVHSLIVLTPPSSHLEWIERAAAAGKHVLIEKPLALDVPQAERSVILARHSNIKLGVVLQHRFRPNALKLAEVLASGMLGKIEASIVSVPWWRPQEYYDEPGRGTIARDGGGVLMTQAIHTIDLFRALAGPIVRVAAVAVTTGLHRMETEDLVSAVMELEGGGVATLMATTAYNPGKSECIELICREGSAKLEGNSLTLNWLDGRAETLTGEARSGAGASPMDFSSGPHRMLISDFLDAVEQNREPRVSGEDALSTQYLIDAMLESSRRRTWVDVPR